MSSLSNKTNEKQEEESGDNVVVSASTSMSIDDLAETVRINMDLDTTFSTPTSRPNDVDPMESNVERQVEMLTPVEQQLFYQEQQLLLSRLMQQKSRLSETEIISPVATNLVNTMEVEGMLSRARVSRSIMESQLSIGPTYAKKEAEFPEVTWGFKGDRRDLKNSPPTEQEKTIFSMAILTYFVYQFNQQIGQSVVLSVLKDIADSLQASEVSQLLNQPRELWDQVLYMRLYTEKTPLLNKDFSGLVDDASGEKQELIDTMYYKRGILRDELMKCVGQRKENKGNNAHWIILVIGTSIYIEVAMQWEKTIMLNKSTEEAFQAELEGWMVAQFHLLSSDGVMFDIIGGRHNPDECFAFLLQFGLDNGIKWGREIVKERRERHQAGQEILKAQQQGLPNVVGPFSSPPKPIRRKMPLEEEEDEMTQLRRELEETRQALSQAQSPQFQQSQQTNKGPSLTRSTLGTSVLGQLPMNGNAVNINIVSQADQVRVPPVKFDPNWFDGKPTLAKFTVLLEQGLGPWISYYLAQANMNSLTSMADILNHLGPTSKIVGTKRWKWTNCHVTVPVGQMESIADLSQHRSLSVYSKFNMIIGACTANTILDFFTAIDSISCKEADIANDESLRNWMLTVKRFVYMLLGRTFGPGILKPMLEGISQYIQAGEEFQDMLKREKKTMENRVGDPKNFQAHNHRLKLTGDPEAAFQSVIERVLRTIPQVREMLKVYSPFFESGLTKEQCLSHAISNNMFNRTIGGRQSSYSSHGSQPSTPTRNDYHGGGKSQRTGSPYLKVMEEVEGVEEVEEENNTDQDAIIAVIGEQEAADLMVLGPSSRHLPPPRPFPSIKSQEIIEKLHKGPWVARDDMGKVLPRPWTLADGPCYRFKDEERTRYELAECFLCKGNHYKVNCPDAKEGERVRIANWMNNPDSRPAKTSSPMPTPKFHKRRK